MVNIAMPRLTDLRRYSMAAAAVFFAGCIISAALDAVQRAAVISRLSVSQHYVSDPAADAGIYEPVGAAVSVLQFTGVTLMLLVGFAVISQMAMPMLPIQIAAGARLIIKGFREEQPEIAADLAFK